MTKKIQLALIGLVVTIGMASCKKEGENIKTSTEGDQKINAKFIGKWDFDTKKSIRIIEGITNKEVEPGLPGEYIDFRADGTALVKEDGDEVEKLTYTLDNDKQLTLNDDGEKTTYRIELLTENKFELSYKRLLIGGSKEEIIRLKR